MKIGLLSIFPYHNFGGILQLYALQRILKEKGHEAWAIKRQKGIMPFWRVPLAFVKRVILKYVFFREIDLFIERTIAQREKILYSNTSKFINKYIQPQTFPIYFKKDLIKMKKKYGFEGYVVGSDQVWRPKYLPVGLDEYFLSFTEDDNVIRVAYSASFGTDEWEYTKEQTEMSSRLAKKFNNVSVREKSAINLCKSKFGINAIHTLDPTMLLEKSDYIGIVKDEGVEKSPGELLVYLLDKREDNNKLIEIVSKELNIRPFKVNKPTEYEDEQVAKRIAPPVESWLRGFYDAEFILTDSFHGTIFSIIFNKPFIVYANPHRGMARFQSLLDMFNLEDRIIHSISELDINLVKKTLDWKKVNEILNVQRKISHEYLNSLLNITNC